MSAAGAATFNAGVTASQLAITSASTADTATFTRGTNGQNNIFKFVTGSTADWIVGERNDSTSDFRFYSYGTSSDVLSIARATGNVGIGTIVPYAKLSVKDGTNINLGIKVGQTDATAVMLNAYNDAVTANIPMEFRASKFNFESGNVGIGTSSPDQKLVVQAGNIKLKSTADGNNGVLMLYDAAGTQSGQVYPSAGDLRIWSPNDVLILPTGNVLVGKTVANIGVTGQELRADGSNYFTSSSDTALGLNRLSSDGKVLEIRRDSTIVGSIGAQSGDLNIGTTNCGLLFNDGTPIIIPTNVSTNAVANGTIDLGYSAGRFKDAYLSGTVAATTYTGSGADLTGIPILAFAATGGTITTITGYKVHTFTSSGTFTATKSGTVEILIVAGGGNGANTGGGGGGGGGVLHNTSKLLAAGTYTVTVGAGGSGNSAFGTMTAFCGGAGSGVAGGSGGGQGHQSPTNLIGALATQPSADGMGYGNAGGGHTYANPYPSGGGGGAGGPGGVDAFNSTGRNGFAGPGKRFSLNGTTTYYAGGGGGGYYYGGGIANAGGIGGGGAYGVVGTANTGGGGGGSSTQANADAKAGGSGIVIVRYVV
jgi:hypothetical protein